MTAMYGEHTLGLLGSAVIVMAIILFRPNSGKRIILFVILLALGAMLAFNLTIKGVLVGLGG